MIKKLHENIQSGKVSSTDLTRKYISNIKRKNEKLFAFLSVHSEKAIEQAASVDDRARRGEKIGLLEGIPCAIKDNITIKGTIATAASKILENYVAPYDATVIKKLKKEFSVFVGKTNLDEFAMGSSTENSAFGTTKNPHDESRVPGGSSGGSACAVAADLTPWALGSDTGGSIRQPASLCGVVGFKPTYGRVSRYGLIAMASSYDQIGPITKSVEDAAIVLDAICGKDQKDNTTTEKDKSNFAKELEPQLKGKKIGISREFFTEGLDPKVKKVIEAKIAYAEQQGAEIIDVNIPHLKYSMAVYYIMMPSEVSSNLARLDGIRYGFSDALNINSKGRTILDVYLNSRATAFGDEPKRRIMLGTYALSSGYYDAYYKKAQQIREVIKREINDAFKKVDVLLSPTSPTPAFKIGDKTDNPLEMYLTDVYTVTANVAMIPAISIPAGFVSVDGKELPIGLQLMGKWWGEQELLNISHALESSNNNEQP